MFSKIVNVNVWMYERTLNNQKWKMNRENKFKKNHLNAFLFQNFIENHSKLGSSSFRMKTKFI